MSHRKASSTTRTQPASITPPNNTPRPTNHHQEVLRLVTVRQTQPIPSPAATAASTAPPTKMATTVACGASASNKSSGAPWLPGSATAVREANRAQAGIKGQSLGTFTRPSLLHLREVFPTRCEAACARNAPLTAAAQMCLSPAPVESLLCGSSGVAWRRADVGTRDGGGWGDGRRGGRLAEPCLVDSGSELPQFSLDAIDGFTELSLRLLGVGG